MRNAGEISKKKSFQTCPPKCVPVISKAPVLSTAVRAKQRARFEEQLRDKERQRQAALKAVRFL